MNTVLARVIMYRAIGGEDGLLKRVGNDDRAFQRAAIGELLQALERNFGGERACDLA